jgi:hypothetical protein
MSPSRKSAGPGSPRARHTRRRHGPITPTAPTDLQPTVPVPPPAPPPTEAVAGDPLRSEDDATCVALPPEKQVAWVEVVALEAAGWHVVELRPSGTDELALWRVTIQRYDANMTMTLQEADPDVALEELVRYVQVDAR